MFPTLTREPCDCCGETLVDDVGLVLVCDAVRAYREELEALELEREAVWEDAHARHRRILDDLKRERSRAGMPEGR